jgi:signal transduction histidine kinase
MERLLHALNQPLTGLQCSLEVALAAPRTEEYYAARMREGLELTERMRALVETLREMASAGAENLETGPEKEAETFELKSVLREVVDDLRPVAEAKSVGIALEGSAVSTVAAGAVAIAIKIKIKKGRRNFFSLAFRTLEAVLSLADEESGLRIELGGGAADSAGGAAESAAGKDQVWVRITWQSKSRPQEFCRAELGLLVAQAGWEGAGARWDRQRVENRETVTVRLPGVSGVRN